MYYDKIVLKDSCKKLCVINPGGHDVKCENAHIRGWNPMFGVLTCREIIKLLKSNIPVQEHPAGINSDLVALNISNAKSVFSEAHLKYLGDINTGYIDMYDTILAGKPTMHKAADPVKVEVEVKQPEPEVVKEEPVFEEVVNTEPAVAEVAEENDDISVSVTVADEVVENAISDPEPDPAPEKPVAQSAPRSNRKKRNR